MKKSNPLWEFSTSIYRKQGVSEILLHIQDEFSIDVNIILFAAWLASIDRALKISDIQNAEKLVAIWREEVIEPIRKTRKSLKRISNAASFYENIKILEIDAEEEELRILYENFVKLSSDEPRDLNQDLLEYNLKTINEFSFFDENELGLKRLIKILADPIGVAKKGSE